MARVLVADDDPFMRGSLLDALHDDGHDGEGFASAREALEAHDERSFDLVITDLKMPGMNGIELLDQIRLRDAQLPVLLITAHGTVETAVQAMKRGASDYILKPFGAEELRLLVGKAIEHRRLLGENEALKRELKRRSDDRPFLGESAAIRAVRERITAVCRSDATILIRGETGTGKELVARSIHYGSPRAERPFLCVNCAALSAGLLESELFGHERGAFTGADRARSGRFEMAEGGSLLLDEVSEIDNGLQAKLLRVLQEKEFERVGSSKTKRADVRVIATTNRDLEQEVRIGRFREDLYFRLNIVPIDVPPLRERKEDIALLADHFLEQAIRRSGRKPGRFSEKSRRELLSYHWPGNVRELENLIERAALLSLGEEIDVDGLRAEGVAAPPIDAGRLRGMALEDVERLLIADTLRLFGGHQKKTAASLGIGVRTLRDKIKKWDLYAARREAVTV
ncbi:MAG: sigma-54 dependent transcriptional regulator [Planctomycetes bacterium]|nr:sigma-54 dependent transcriptional regulator [Planctomycetota bacterium]